MGINLFLTSLVTDMSFAVERLEQEDPQFCEDGSAFTDAYALVDCTFGAGAVLGPLISGLLYENTTWAIAYGVLAAFCFSGSLPVVSAT
jgi:MFS family permease